MRFLNTKGWLAVACLTLVLILLAMCAVDSRQRSADKAR